MMKNAALKVLALVVSINLLIPLAIAGPGGSDQPRPRFMDLVNTRLRNAVVDLGMDLVKKPMVDPAIDEGEVFSYFLRPSFQLGIRGEPQATQVIDGHLWTGAAEWMLLLGDPPEPVSERIWTLHKGYLPCIQYTVKQDGVAYTVRAFQFYLKDEKPAGDRGGSAPVNFIQVRAENTSDGARTAVFAAGAAYGIRDHRSPQMKQMNFNPAWSWRMTGKAALRDGRIIYAWREPPDELQSRPGKTYQGGSFFVPSRGAPAALSVYRRELGPGRSVSVEFAMPHYPAAPGREAVLSSASFEERLLALENYWEGWIERGARFEVPEQKVMEASKSYLIHALMSQNVVSEDEVAQHVNRLHYNHFWLRDSAFFVSMYENWGYAEVGRALCRHIFRYQQADGNFLSQRGQLDGWGQAMWALGSHVRYAGDHEFAREALPYAERGVAWLENALAEDAWGLMPPTDAFDNEMILGRYTGHNFWSLTGLAAGIDLARAAGRQDLADKWELLHRQYHQHFMARLRQVAQEREGRIPPGLDVPGGTDWGNLLMLYPDLHLDPFDPLVTNTMDYIRRERMAEGISMWQNSLHHYITERIAQTSLVRGEQELVINDFYGMLLHTGSCHEGFEWTIFPWNGRDYCVNLPGFQLCNFPPHGWYAVTLNLLLRNMLVREQGTELHLISAISPAWARPGDVIRVKDAPTRFGEVSFTMSFDEKGALLAVSEAGGRSDSPPEKIVVHLPYFAEVKAATLNGLPLALTGEAIELSPRGELRLRLDWEQKPGLEKSYQSTVEWFKAEYRRRWEQRP